jgi:hypothetical protein
MPIMAEKPACCKFQFAIVRMEVLDRSPRDAVCYGYPAATAGRVDLPVRRWITTSEDDRDDLAGSRVHAEPPGCKMQGAKCGKLRRLEEVKAWPS